MKSRNLLILAFFSFLMFKSYAQEQRQGKVIGVISLGNQEYATVEDLNNGCRCKTSPYERGNLTPNENVKIKVTDERKLVEKGNFEIICKDFGCDNTKSAFDKENLIKVIGKHHNEALHNLNQEIEYTQELVSDLNFDEFISMAEQDAFNAYKNYTNGTRFYPSAFSNNVIEFNEIKEKLISGTQEGLDIPTIKEGLLELKSAYITNQNIIIDFSSEKDYNLIIETLSKAILLLDDNNKNRFDKDINNLISEWNKEQFFKKSDNSGVPSGLVLGVAKGSSQYWFVDIKPHDEDEIGSIPGPLVVDLGAAALQALELAFKEAITEGGTDQTFEDYVVSVAWAAVKGSFLGGVVSKVGKFLKWFD